MSISLFDASSASASVWFSLHTTLKASLSNLWRYTWTSFAKSLLSSTRRMVIFFCSTVVVMREVAEEDRELRLVPVDARKSRLDGDADALLADCEPHVGNDPVDHGLHINHLERLHRPAHPGEHQEIVDQPLHARGRSHHRIEVF